MKWRRNNLRKISVRLTIVYAALFFWALVTIHSATLLFTNYYIHQTAADQIRLVDEAIQSELGSASGLEQIDLSEYARMTENVDIRLFVNQVEYTGTEEAGTLPKLPVPDAHSTGDVQKIETDQGHFLLLNDQVTLPNQKVVGIQIIKDLDHDSAFMLFLSGTIVFLDLVALVVAVSVGYWISRKALSPIDRITQQAQRISASDLSCRLDISGPDDELKRLSDAFNDLISRIQIVYEKQNQFTLDASHELATPLAVIKGYVDLIDRWGKEDRAILDEALGSIKNELGNMTRLLDTLLFVAKGDNEILNLEKTVFSLDKLILEIIRESELITTRHTIQLLANEPMQLEADRKMIKQMIRAVLDNSIKYTPDQGSISIDSRCKGLDAVISIIDTGIGIPKTELGHIFDRFYRVDKARSRAAGGSGLGLSIVQWIATIHGGHVKVESEQGQGTTMYIHLPLHKAQ